MTDPFQISWPEKAADDGPGSDERDPDAWGRVDDVDLPSAPVWGDEAESDVEEPTPVAAPQPPVRFTMRLRSRRRDAE